MKLTINEKQFLEELKSEFRGDIETRCDGGDFCQSCSLGAKVARGVLSSLIKKGVLDYYGNLPENKDCFNPIYKGVNYID